MLDARRCYQALLSKDRRFDGRFFVGVRTTGVYCRPICPAPPPRERNVSVFACAAAAEAAGFRPCRRCRPEAAAGTPAWLGSCATVSRALRLIHEGALDAAGVDDLARRLGVGSRHLRRLFLEHLGATPAAIARTRRVHFARRLLDSTTLPMTEIATGAGFCSIRRFNAAMRAAFGASPTELRARTGARTLGRTGAQSGGPTRTRTGTRRPARDGDGIMLRLTYRPPLDWERLLGFLRARAIPGVEHVEGGVYRRTIRYADGTGILAVRPDPDRSEVEVHVPACVSRELQPIADRVQRLFDLGADPLPIATHLRRDPLLAGLLRVHAGVRVAGAWDGFETAVRVILGQQVTVRAATTLAGRLVRALGEPLAHPDAGLTHLFPDPARVVDAPLRGLGITGQRVRCLRELARAAREGSLQLGPAGDLDDAVRRLRAIPGIGPWTAQVIALRVLGEPDAFPAGDLGLRRALAGARRPAPEREILARAEAWRPWRAYAVMLLWQA
jgi:AraC family transcriptional regulator of adaptative response / DNA-3-methyladenine glycosylase II